MRQRWNTPLYAVALGAGFGILGMLAAGRVSLPGRIFPARPVAPPVQPADHASDALGASLARSTAESGQRALRSALDPAGRAVCEAAIADADAAACRAAEDARGKQHNTQSLAMVLSAEDLYLAAARLRLREARPVC
ncbi:hypothetical protein E2C06_05300 [Dankookia rubra]|uniref:Uncharacterized protein n=1 Tax=Dankookia rubra TaxID=1442381 RepID=A0A4R5QKW5_9PROT|nr:hypothetical protein [Dankookia rubra]TDH63743.1 hypothetical protein E2C06_05300 [Dankookia rubra]